MLTKVSEDSLLSGHISSLCSINILHWGARILMHREIPSGGRQRSTEIGLQKRSFLVLTPSEFQILGMQWKGPVMLQLFDV
jgi:hypothetical protein